MISGSHTFSSIHQLFPDPAASMNRKIHPDVAYQDKLSLSESMFFVSVFPLMSWMPSHPSPFPTQRNEILDKQLSSFDEFR